MFTKIRPSYLLWAATIAILFAVELSHASGLGSVFVIWLFFHTAHTILGWIVIKHIFLDSQWIYNIIYNLIDKYTDSKNLLGQRLAMRLWLRLLDDERWFKR